MIDDKLKGVDFNLIKLSHRAIPKNQPPPDLADAKHQSMMDAIAPYAKKVEQRNMTPVYVDYKTRKTKMAWVLCPEWAPQFPPFNIARLSGVAKSAGYESVIYDVNAKAYELYKSNKLGELPFRLWDPSSSWHWLGDTYINDIHPVLEPLLNEYVDKILDSHVDIVGFTLYYINQAPSEWMIKELKRRNPQIKIAVGGSNVQKSWFKIEPYYDYVVVGEGENLILKVLGEVERGVVYPSTQVYKQDESERININNLPMPDYESIDFNQYEMPNGVNSEFSRGCTAKCTFCEETHFWKYRQRQAVDAIQEIEWLYYNKGTDVIWFIDSLVNGNIKELRAFSLAVAAKGLKIHWTGYARCDGRMDLDYFKDLKAGGCIMLNYGVESGSQKVLNDMDKGVTVEEMEANFKDGTEVGVFNATNWIVGFPTEDFQDFADSMTFLWRVKEYNINNVGAGVGYGMGPETIVGQNPDKFNVLGSKYQGHWITRDFKKGGTHVMHRVKNFHIYLDLISTTVENSPFSYPVRFSLAQDHYRIKFHDADVRREVEYEKFDYNIIPEIEGNAFASTLVNEMWPLFRTLWRVRGGFDMVVRFNPEIDLKEFGSQFGPGMYTATYRFTIDYEGNWSADFDMIFDQIDNNFDDRDPNGPDAHRRGPFYAQDYSKMDSNAAFRARKLAKPTWGQEGRSSTDFGNLLREEKKLNEEIDFSFKKRWQGSGKWQEIILTQNNLIALKEIV